MKYENTLLNTLPVFSPCQHLPGSSNWGESWERSFGNYIFLMLQQNHIVTYIYQSSFIGAIAVGDLVKSTLGPKGMVRAMDIYTM